MGREIKKEYLIVTGILLVLLTGGWLYFSDIRGTFDLNPDIFYIVEDRLSDNGQLRVSTRGNDYGETKDLLLWRYGNEEMILYKNNRVLVKSEWLVKGYGLKKIGVDELSYLGDQSEGIVNIFRNRAYNTGVFTESTVIDSIASFEQFPSKHVVEYVDDSGYKRSLTWRLTNVEFPDSLDHGKYYGCEINTVNNVKINWCNDIDKMNYAFVDKTKKQLSVYFLYALGEQEFSVSVTDPPADYFIVGNSVLQEDAFSKLEVYPAYSSSPPGTINTQIFDLDNKTLNDVPNAHLAYVFDFEISDGGFEVWVEPEYGLVSNSITCDFDYSYELNKFPGEINPHEATCFRINDMNTISEVDDVQEILWVRPFKTGDIESKTINYDVNTMISSGSWVDKSFLMKHASVNGKHIYYLDEDIFIGAKESVKWRIKYRVPKGIISGKYVLIYYVGNIDCILNNTCSYKQEMDPWFNNDWGYKKAITINANGVTGKWFQIIDLNSDTLGGDASNFWDNTRADGFDAIFVNSSEDTILESYRLTWVNDVNAIYLVEIPSMENQTIYLYYSNAGASDDSNSSVIDLFDDFSDGDYSSNPTWTVANRTWSAATGKLISDVSADPQIYSSNVITDYTQIRLSFDINSGTSSFADFWLSGVNNIGTPAYVIRQGTNGLGFDDYNVSYRLIFLDSTINTSNEYLNIQVTRDKKGLWRVFYNGSLVGSDINTAYNDLASFALYTGSTASIGYDNIRFWSSTETNEPEYSIGSAQTSAVSPDVNVVSPNGGEYYDNASVSTVSIDFNVMYTDNNSVLADINYSASGVQGTGTNIISDVNTDSVTITCADSDFSNSTACSYSWNIDAVADGNYFILIDVNGGLTTRVFDASDNNFNIFTTPNVSPDMNVVFPSKSGLQFIDGNVIVIDFNVVDVDNNAVSQLIDINYGTTSSQGTGTVIINDGNVAETVGLYCDSNNLVTVQECHYDWTVPVENDDFYILISVYDGVNIDFNSSENTFLIDSTDPTTTADNNTNWQNVDSNVTLTCSDSGSGCSLTSYRIDSDDSNSVSMGSWQTWDGNGLYFYLDGNFAFDFNSTDGVGNIETTNRSYVTIDKTSPVLSDPTPSSNSLVSDTTPDLNVAFTETNPWYCTVTPIVNDVNGSDSNATLTSGRCLYTSSTLSENDTIRTCFVMTDLAGNVSSELCTSTYTIMASYYFGNVKEDYSTDVNEAVFYPSSLVDQNVTPSGQNDTNGFWQFENVSLGDTNVSVIMRNRRVLFNFEQDWVKWKRVPNTDALLAVKDTNSYQGQYCLNLRSYTAADYNVSTWVNNQFIVDINSEYNTGADLNFRIKVTDINQISDINFIIGNDSVNNTWFNLATIDANSLNDNFSDGNFLIDPEWVIATGSFDASSGKLKNTNAGSSRISTDLNSPNYNSLSMSFDFNKVSANASYIWFTNSTRNISVTDEGYGLIVHSATDTISLAYHKNGSQYMIVSGVAGYTSGTEFNVKVTRDSDFNWELFIDGVSKGTGIDNNNSSSNFFVVEMGSQNTTIDNIDVNLTTQIQDLNSIYPSNSWFEFNIDLNLAINNQIGIINWSDINYFSIKVTEVTGASDYNILIDDLVVTPSTNPINNWGNGSSFCIDDDNLMSGCLDLNTSSPAFIIPSSSNGNSNKIWIWADLNLTNYTPFDLFEFDFNWSFGGIPNAN